MKFSEKGIEILIEEFDHGAEKILEALEELEHNPFVKVGIIESNTKHKIKSKAGRNRPQPQPAESDPPSVAQVATWMEYGLEIDGVEVVPPRSFINTTMKEKFTELQTHTVKIFDQILDGKISVSDGLNIIGLDIVSKMKKKIDSNIPPPLKESTIKSKTRAGKAGNVALVDTGQMRNSIQHLVVLHGEHEEHE